MYLPLTTVAGVHLRREDLFRESQGKKKAVTVVTVFFFCGSL